MGVSMRLSLGRGRHGPLQVKPTRKAWDPGYPGRHTPSPVKFPDQSIYLNKFLNHVFMCPGRQKRTPSVLSSASPKGMPPSYERLLDHFCWLAGATMAVREVRSA